MRLAFGKLETSRRPAAATAPRALVPGPGWKSTVVSPTTLKGDSGLTHQKSNTVGGDKRCAVFDAR